MEIKVIELTTITASEGMYLTNGNVYCKTVHLGVNDSPANWHEITDAEYNEIQEKNEVEE